MKVAIEEAIAYCIVHTLHMNPNQTIDVLKIPEADREKYRLKIEATI